MKQIIDKQNMTEADWQEYRRNQKGFGGSDAATILNLNPYKSPFTLWLEKTGQIEPAKVENEYVEWGNLLEPLIREKFRRETGFEVFENHFVLEHDEHEFMVANIDGEVIDPQFSDRGILEVKTASDRFAKDWEEGCPNHYMLQIQHYLAVTGYEYAYIAVLIGGHQFKYFLIHRDDYVIDALITAEMEFHEKIEKRVAPEITGSKSDSDFLAEAFFSDNGEEVYLSSELEEKAFRYISLQEEIKTLQGEAEALKNHLRLKAGEAKIFKGDKVRVLMPSVKKVTFDSERFAADHPDLYKQYKTKESSYRRFTINLLK